MHVRGTLIAFGLTCALASTAMAYVGTRNVDVKAHFDEYAQYSACWSYIHPDGREYAILGTTTGTAIYNVTNPEATYRVGFIPGVTNSWREMKSYRNWIYVTTEGVGSGPTAGVQIISMVNPESPVLVGNYTTNFITAHTVAVDTARALLFVNGTRTASQEARGMHILSLANPTAPSFVARWPAGTGTPSQTDYIHDCVPIGNRLYASSIYAGIERVFDITNPSTPVQISSWTYPGAFTHSAWPDLSGKFLYVADEVAGQKLKIFDIQNVTAPVLVNEITSNPHAIVHNPRVKGKELYLSNYTEGIRILDISDPIHPAEFAWADSWFGASGGFHSVWEVCPYFPSGTVIASDKENGLYVYRPVRNYGLLRIQVQGPASQPAAVCGVDVPCCCGSIATCSCGPSHHTLQGGGLDGVSVYLPSQGDSITTSADGIVILAANPGPQPGIVRKFGYYDVMLNVDATARSSDTITVNLVPRPLRDYTGTVRNDVTLAPLEEAEVNLLYTPLHQHTNAAGQFSFFGVPEDLYRIDVRSPGYVPLSTVRPLSTNRVDDFRLVPAPYYDALESSSPWIVGSPSDNATGGIWVRAEPLGTGQPQRTPRLIRKPGAGAQQPRTASPFAAQSLGGGGPVLDHEGHEEDGATPGEVQPEFDRTPPPGTMCFITGQGTIPNSIGESDIDGGKTSLTTPPLNMTSYIEPMIGYWHWFYGASELDDWLKVWISGNNGVSWTLVETVTGLHNHWMERNVRVRDYVTPGSMVRLKFEAADEGENGIVEAAIDDLSAYDGTSVSVDVPVPAAPVRLAFAAVSPNPSRGDVSLSLDLPAASSVSVELLDVQGRRVATLYRGAAPAGRLPLRWGGRDEAGRMAPTGLYFVRATTAQGVATTRFVRAE